MPVGISVWGLFVQADGVVKSVIIGLVVASVISWGIFFSKILLLRRLKRVARRIVSEGIYLEKWDARSRFKEDDPFSELVEISVREYHRWERSREWNNERFEHMVSIHLDQQREYLMKHVGVIGSIGSMAPFVGLFGTVWGILNGFQILAVNKGASLMPVIAEALFATAIGLIVAIPAVVAHDKLMVSIHSYLTSLENFSQEIYISFLSFKEKFHEKRS